MGKRDAFGREVGEDSLAELGWREPTPTTAVQPDYQAAQPVAPEIPGVRRRRRFPVVRLVVLLAVLGAIAWGGMMLVRVGGDVVDDLSERVESGVGNVVEAEPPPQGLEPGSLLRQVELGAALDKLPEGDIESLRVAPERIDTQVIVDGRMVLVQVTHDARVSTVETPATGRGDAVRVDPAAPSRIARTAARRARRDVTDVSYLVLSRFGGTSEWQLFFSDGMHFSASANGKKVRKVG